MSFGVKGELNRTILTAAASLEKVSFAILEGGEAAEDGSYNIMNVPYSLMSRSLAGEIPKVRLDERRPGWPSSSLCKARLFNFDRCRQLVWIGMS